MHPKSPLASMKNCQNAGWIDCQESEEHEEAVGIEQVEWNCVLRPWALDACAYPVSSQGESAS